MKQKIIGSNKIINKPSEDKSATFVWSFAIVNNSGWYQNLIKENVFLRILLRTTWRGRGQQNIFHFYPFANAHIPSSRCTTKTICQMPNYAKMFTVYKAERLSKEIVLRVVTNTVPHKQRQNAPFRNNNSYLLTYIELDQIAGHLLIRTNQPIN